MGQFIKFTVHMNAKGLKSSGGRMSAVFGALWASGAFNGFDQIERGLQWRFTSRFDDGAGNGARAWFFTQNENDIGEFILLVSVYHIAR